MKPIYLDTAASTPLDSAVFKAMRPFLAPINPHQYANASSPHDPGRNVREVIEHSRRKVAHFIMAQPEEIIFTSGGTESINLAIKGLALAREKGHIITSTIEHPSVLETCRSLENKGFSVSYVGVDKNGLVDHTNIAKAIRKDTILISIMYVNNELGTIQPLIEIAKIAHGHNIPFHTDACQAGLLDLNVPKLGVDLMTLNGAKINGPKGVGILYRRQGINLEPLFHGGGQEFGLRSGTENVPAIVGLVKALELMVEKRKKNYQHLQKLQDYFQRQLLKIPKVRLLGHPQQRLPTITTVAFQNIDAEQLVNYLNLKGIYASSGSACASQKVEQSHVLKAIRLPESWGSVRFSLPLTVTTKELAAAAEVVGRIVKSLRDWAEKYPGTGKATTGQK